MSSIARLPFDTIAIRSEGGEQHLSVTQLLAIGLNERVRLLAEGRLCFTAHGERVDPQVALRALFHHRRASATTLRLVRARPTDDG
jgi:hypothetical protein